MIMLTCTNDRNIIYNSYCDKLAGTMIELLVEHDYGYTSFRFKKYL